MTEEEISSTGRFAALGAGEVASYHVPNTTARPSVSAAPAATSSPASAAAAPAAAATAKPGKPPTQQEIDQAIAAANANLAASDRVLDYRVDAATGISIALIRNAQTGVVLQQIPGADIIALARMLAEWAPGKHMLLDLIA